MQDKATSIEKVSKFLGIELDAELKRVTLQQSSLEFMAAHRSKYDEHQLKLCRNEAMGLDRTAGLGNSNQVRCMHFARTRFGLQSCST
jgi:hypothetical protein